MSVVEIPCVCYYIEETHSAALILKLDQIIE